MIREIVKEARKFENYPTFTVEDVTDFLGKCEVLGLTPNRMVRKYIERKIPFSFDENIHLSEICETRLVDNDAFYRVVARMSGTFRVVDGEAWFDGFRVTIADEGIWHLLGESKKIFIETESGLEEV